MADDVQLPSGSGGATMATDEDAGASRHYQIVKLADGTANSETRIESGNGTAAGALRVSVASDTTGVLSVDDNGASLTVDNADIATIAGAVSGTEMQVDLVSANVTNAGTFATQVDGAALTALQLIDDIVHTDDTSTHATGTTKGALIMGAATPTDGAVAANDIGAVAMSLDRRLHVDADITANSADLMLGTDFSNVLGPNPLYTSGTIQDGVGNDLDVVNVRNLNYVYNGTTFDLMREGGEAGSVLVDLGANNDVTVSGTVAVDLGANNDVTIDGSSIVHAEDAVHGSGDAGIMPLAVRNDALAALAGTDGDYAPLQVDASGSLYVTGGGGGTEYTEDAVAAADPVGTALLMPREDSPVSIAADGDNVALRANAYGAAFVTLVDASGNQTVSTDINDLSTVGGQAIALNSSVADNGTIRVTVATDDVVSVDLGANNDVTVTSGTITANLGATDNAVLDDIAAKLAPHTTNGHSFYLNQDTSAVASVKASAGTIYWIACMSTDATPVYLNLYNVASGSVTLGTTTPSMQFIVPSQGDANGSGFTINFGPHGIQFGTAITVACATTFNGSTDPGTNVVITNIGYE